MSLHFNYHEVVNNGGYYFLTWQPGMVAYFCNPSTQEAGTKAILRPSPAAW